MGEVRISGGSGQIPTSKLCFFPSTYKGSVCVFFLLLLIVLRLLSRLLQPVIEHLPVIRQFNRLLGAAAGFIQGVVTISVVFWFLERLGLVGEELVAGSYLLSLFIR